MRYSRVILIVVDGFGVGLVPSERNGMQNQSTFEDIIDKVGPINIPVLESMGLLELTKKYTCKCDKQFNAMYGKMFEKSPYKDSWAGHWELAGWKYINVEDSSYWRRGFSQKIIKDFEKSTGYRVVGNKAFLRREDVIYSLVEEHKKDSKSVIVLTEEGIESIRTFGVYALTSTISSNKLYEICEAAAISLERYRNIFGRIGARPLIADQAGTVSVPHDQRKDFLIFDPPSNTILNALSDVKLGCYAVGKISAMFRGNFITESIHTSNNEQSMNGILKFCRKIDRGLIWGNLNDFDAVYGHYFNAVGWKEAFEEFDRQLKTLANEMRDDDLLIICSDGHGCDCIYTGIHTREYSPLIVYGNNISGRSLGCNNILNDIAATISDALGLAYKCDGKSLLVGS